MHGAIFIISKVYKINDKSMIYYNFVIMMDAIAHLSMSCLRSGNVMLHLRNWLQCRYWWLTEFEKLRTECLPLKQNDQMLSGSAPRARINDTLHPSFFTTGALLCHVWTEINKSWALAFLDHERKIRRHVLSHRCARWRKVKRLGYIFREWHSMVLRNLNGRFKDPFWIPVVLTV